MSSRMNLNLMKAMLVIVILLVLILQAIFSNARSADMLPVSTAVDQSSAHANVFWKIAERDH